MIQIFDTHAHYDDESFDDDRERLLAGFPAQGVHAVTNIGTNIRASEETVRMTEKYENLYGVVGIFPSEVAELENPDNVKRLKELAKHDKIVAIGEIGLDYHYEETDKALQHKWFAGQMDIARELKLPNRFWNAKLYFCMISIVTFGLLSFSILSPFLYF